MALRRTLSDEASMENATSDFVRAGTLEELRLKGRIVVHGRHHPVLLVHEGGKIPDKLSLECWRNFFRPWSRPPSSYRRRRVSTPSAARAANGCASAYQYFIQQLAAARGADGVAPNN